MAKTTISNLYVNQGADTSWEISLVNDDGTEKDLTNYTVRAKFAKHPRSVTTHEFIASVAPPATAGVIVLRLLNDDLTSLKDGLYVYDAELVFSDSDETIVERVLEGVLEINPSVTQ